jgi:hypothetical protein
MLNSACRQTGDFHKIFKIAVIFSATKGTRNQEEIKTWLGYISSRLKQTCSMS